MPEYFPAAQVEFSGYDLRIFIMSLKNRRIIVVISGGIAAYKAPEVVRRLQDAGAAVRVVMTPAATQFITPLTLQAVSGQPVRADLFDPEAEAAMGHIELARWCDAMVVAPATADFLARCCLGTTPDLAGALILASAAPVLLAPAMNQQMWQHPATQDNLSVLADRGFHLCGPDSGSQACGEVGPGRMAEPEAIVSATAGLFENRELDGKQVVITAGPTREAIDPVRYISNHSSGKMGYAVAAAARDAGADVTLISGPVTETPPERVQTLAVSSASEMHQMVHKVISSADIFIATAAVADYRPANAAAQKIKRDGEPQQLELTPNVDILASVASLSKAPFTVGFAAETENLEHHALSKLERKNIDMIAANDVSARDIGFNADENELLVLWPGGQQRLRRAPKSRLAVDLVALVAKRYKARKNNEN